MLQQFTKKQVYYIGTLTGLRAKIKSEILDDKYCFNMFLNHTFIDIGNIHTFFNDKRPLQWVKYYDNFNNNYIYIAFPLKDNELIYKCNRGYSINISFKDTIEL